MSTRIILGIDPGFGRMGFGCVSSERGGVRAVDYGIVTTKSGVEFEQRLRQIFEDVEDLIATHRPQVLAIEKLFFAKNSTTAMRVAEARGVILLAAARHQIPVMEFTPAQVKKAVTGNGAADKRAMQKMVSLLLRLTSVPKPDDAADALAIALTAVGARG